MIAARRTLLLSLLWTVLSGCSSGPPDIPRPEMEGAEEPVVAAVEQARAEVAAEPESAAAWGRLGDRLRAQGWVREAAACYLRCEELEPLVFRWPYLAGKSLRLTAPAESVAPFRRALDLDDAYAPAHLFLAQSLGRTGEVEQAEGHYRRAAELDDSLAAAWLGLGQLALSAGRHRESLELLREALRRDPADGRIPMAAAQAAAALGSGEDAARYVSLARGELTPPEIPDPRAALDVPPVGSKQLADHGRQLMARRRLPEAVEALRESVRLDPERAAPQVALGLALLVQGDAGGAEEHLRRAVWLAPSLADARAALGNLLLAGGEARAAEAREHLAAAVRLRPQDPELRERLGAALELLGDDAEAEAEYARAVAQAREQLAVTLAPRARRRLEGLIARQERR